MSNEEEVIRLTKKLDKMVSKKTTDDALDILKLLKKIPINLETLQKTHIGMSVNNVRKQTKNDEVASTAKQLIKSWKKLVSDSPSKKSTDKKSNNVSKSSDVSMRQEVEEEEEDEPEHATSSEEQDPSGLVKATNDPIRDKCREMLSRSLKSEDIAGHSETRVIFLAAAIEEAIFSEFRDTGMRYKNRIRSRFSNLKDAKNSGLRLNVLNGAVTPERIAKMTAEEMASDEMKKLREVYEEQNIKDHQMSVNEGTKTDMFTCGRCKGRACTYTQLQTRSSDEPMTTFVFCTDCGNRWKFC